jgi:hypothetical protein
MRSRVFFMCLVTLAALSVGAISTATASGGGGYHVAFSNNCNNPSVALCAPPPEGFGLGGDWGAVRLNADGTGTGELTTATHQTPGMRNGATHYSIVVSWYVTPTPPFPPVAPDPNGIYLVITVVNIPSLGSLVTPATPGHYSFQGANFGMPGVNFMVQVNAA